MIQYAVLNLDNIAESIVSYVNSVPQSLPSNFIKIEDDSMLWHKYENDIWSTETYKPTETTEKIVTNEEIKQNQIVIMSAINDLYTMISNLNSTSTGSLT